MRLRLLSSALLAVPVCAFAQVARVPATAFTPGALSALPLGAPAIGLALPNPALRASVPVLSIPSQLPALPSLRPGIARFESGVPAAAAVLPAGGASPAALTAAPAAHDLRGGALDSLIERAESLQKSQDAPADGASAASAAAFDGSGIEIPAQDASPVQAAASELPSYLAVADAEDRRWIRSALSAAAKSRTARRVLSQVAAMSKAQGRPVMVEFADLRSNNGEYVYDWGMLRMGLSYKKLAPELSAPVFIHELLHAVQRFNRLPTDAVEMELEAHVVTIQVAKELGIRFKKGEFSREAEHLLRESPEAFTGYVAASYADNLGFGTGQGVAEFERRLLKLLGRSKARALRLESVLSHRQATLGRMRESGQPEEEVRSYERDVVAPAAAELRREGETRARLEADLALLKDPASLQRYRAYARRVRSLIRRAHLQLRRA
ncbi:MAG: hypothetical protein AAB339_06920 [Elusimicrobiota bacterium]